MRTASPAPSTAAPPAAGAIRRATRILLLIQAGAGIAIYAAIIHFLQLKSGLAAALLGLACVLLVRMGIIANNFAIAWWYRSPTPPEHRLRWGGLLRLFLVEYWASMASSSWTMAFRHVREHIFDDSQALPVLLVHGYGCNSGYWHAMSQALTRERISHFGVDLEPVFGSIDDFVSLLDAAVAHVLERSGQTQLVIVAHSMGGLVARAWLQRHGPAGIARIITLGTPHGGTGLANFGWGPNSRQMRYRGRGIQGQPSAWLQQLAAGEDVGLRRLITSIWSHHDNIVSPQASSRLEHARNIEVAGIGHVSLAFAPQVQQLVVEEIRRASLPSPARPH